MVYRIIYNPILPLPPTLPLLRFLLPVGGNHSCHRRRNISVLTRKGKHWRWQNSTERSNIGIRCPSATGLRLSPHHHHTFYIAIQSPLKSCSKPTSRPCSRVLSVRLLLALTVLSLPPLQLPAIACRAPRDLASKKPSILVLVGNFHSSTNHGLRRRFAVPAQVH